MVPLPRSNCFCECSESPWACVNDAGAELYASLFELSKSQAHLSQKDAKDKAPRSDDTINCQEMTLQRHEEQLKNLTCGNDVVEKETNSSTNASDEALMEDGRNTTHETANSVNPTTSDEDTTHGVVENGIRELPKEEDSSSQATEVANEESAIVSEESSAEDDKPHLEIETTAVDDDKSVDSTEKVDIKKEGPECENEETALAPEERSIEEDKRCFEEEGNAVGVSKPVGQEEKVGDSRHDEQRKQNRERTGAVAELDEARRRETEKKRLEERMKKAQEMQRKRLLEQEEEKQRKRIANAQHQRHLARREAEDRRKREEKLEKERRLREKQAAAKQHEAEMQRIRQVQQQQEAWTAAQSKAAAEQHAQWQKQWNDQHNIGNQAGRSGTAPPLQRVSAVASHGPHPASSAAPTTPPLEQHRQTQPINIQFNPQRMRNNTWNEQCGARINRAYTTGQPVHFPTTPVQQQAGVSYPPQTGWSVNRGVQSQPNNGVPIYNSTQQPSVNQYHSQPRRHCEMPQQSRFYAQPAGLTMPSAHQRPPVNMKAHVGLSQSAPVQTQRPVSTSNPNVPAQPPPPPPPPQPQRPTFSPGGPPAPGKGNFFPAPNFTSAPPAAQKPFHHTRAQSGPPPQPDVKNYRLQSNKDTNIMVATAEERAAALKRSIVTSWALQPGTQNLKPVHELLTTMKSVFPPAFGVDVHDYFASYESPEVRDLKKAVKKVRFFLHPDKLPSDLTEEQSLLCTMLWDVISDAWELHEKHNEELGWART